MERSTKKDIIKNILIVFLVIMLILTFFSQTIMNKSLPEVATKYADYKQINDRIRGSATVIAGADHEIVSSEVRKIESVNFVRGQKINKGDVLYTLVPVSESSSETDPNYVDFEAKRSQLQTELNQLLIQKQQYLKGDGEEDVDFEYDIQMKEKQIAQLTEKIANIPIHEQKIDSYKTQIENIETEIDLLKENLEAPNDKLEELNSKMGRYEPTYDPADDIKAKYDFSIKELDNLTAVYNEANKECEDFDSEAESYYVQIDALEEEKLELQTDIDRVTSKISEYESMLSQVVTSTQEYLTLQAALAKADTELSAMEREYHFFKVYKEAMDRADNMSGAETPEQKEEIIAAYVKAKEQYESYTSGNTRTEREYNDLLDTLRLAVTNAEAAFAECGGNRTEAKTYESQISKYNRNLVSYQSSMADCDAQIARLNKDIETLKRGNEKIVERRDRAKVAMDEKKTESDSLESQYNYALLRDEADIVKAEIKGQTKLVQSKEKDLENANEELAELKADDPGDVDDLSEQKSLAERELDVLNRKFEAAKNNETYDDNIRKLEMANLDTAIAQKNKEITKTYKDEEKQKAQDAKRVNEILSPVSGTITSISYSADQTFEIGATLATVSPSQSEYTMEFWATTEQCRRINIGDIVEVQNYYWGDPPKIVVSSFKPDRENPNRGRTVVMTVTGEDVQGGETFNIALGDKSRYYDKVVPNSALREDSNGKFVLVVDSKSTPLGNRYTARRIDVEVLASDETSSALSGEFQGGEFIITTASVPISDGMQVRLADN